MSNQIGYKQDDEDLYWNSVITPQKFSDDKLVICGHTARTNGEIANFGHTICIDTFAHGGIGLTCIDVETKEFIQANETGETKRGITKPSCLSKKNRHSNGLMTEKKP